MKAIERLEALLDERDAKIAELQEKVDEHEDREAWSWTRHRTTEKETDERLPVPRLEIRWEPADENRYNWHARYFLVHRHLLGNIVSVPMGYTRRGGGGEPVRDSEVETPFRDGCHIAHDAAHLGLPAFAVYGDKVTKIEPRKAKS